MEMAMRKAQIFLCFFLFLKNVALHTNELYLSFYLYYKKQKEMLFSIFFPAFSSYVASAYLFLYIFLIFFF